MPKIKDVGDFLSLAEIWAARDKDPRTPKGFIVGITEKQRRYMEREVGRALTPKDLQTIVSALFDGVLKIR